MRLMKRHKHTLLYVLAVLALVLTVNVARADAATKFCGGKSISRVWVAGKTSCSLGRDVRRKVVRVAKNTGETPRKVRVHCIQFVLKRTSSHGSDWDDSVGVWRNKTKTHRVDFWIP